MFLPCQTGRKQCPGKAAHCWGRAGGRNPLAGSIFLCGSVSRLTAPVYQGFFKSGDCQEGSFPDSAVPLALVTAQCVTIPIDGTPDLPLWGSPQGPSHCVHSPQQLFCMPSGDGFEWINNYLVNNYINYPSGVLCDAQPAMQTAVPLPCSGGLEGADPAQC